MTERQGSDQDGELDPLRVASETGECCHGIGGRRRLVHVEVVVGPCEHVETDALSPRGEAEYVVVRTANLRFREQSKFLCDLSLVTLPLLALWLRHWRLGRPGRSTPMVVSSPWPGMTSVASGSVKSSPRGFS